MTEDQRKHLEFLQSAITRMGQNSFAIKGWAVTIVSALLALSAKDATRLFALLGVFPALLFMLLDAYYLALEKSFRRQYQASVANYGASGQVADFFIQGEIDAATFWEALGRPSIYLLYLFIAGFSFFVWWRFG